MADGSDVFIVRGSLQLIESGDVSPETTSLLFFTGASTTQSWTAPWNCHVVNVFTVGGTAQCQLATDASTYAINFAAAGNGKQGTVLYIGGLANSHCFYPQNFPIHKNQKLYFSNSGAGNGSILVILTIDPA